MSEKNEIILDINGITTGMVRGKELEDESGEYSDLKVGDKVTATVLELENEKGFVEGMSRRLNVDKKIVWEAIDWWKNKVIWKRPLTKDDAKAWRMIEKRIIKRQVLSRKKNNN